MLFRPLRRYGRSSPDLRFPSRRRSHHWGLRGLLVPLLLLNLCWRFWFQLSYWYWFWGGGG
jgi:hypothetical protein